MNIYLGNETNFNNNGLGFLTDIISYRVLDELNGNYQLSMEYILNGHLSEYLVEDNIIKCNVGDGTKQLFVITNVEKNFKTMKITAKHIFYTLLNNFLEDTYPQDQTCMNMIQHILDNTNFNNNFTAFSDIQGTKTARYVRMNPVQAIMGDVDNSVVNLFGGELKRDNFTINMLARVGENNGVKLIIGKNITGITLTIDITKMATRIMPVGYNGLILPEKYVDSTLINNYPTPKITTIEFKDVKYDPNDEKAYHNLNDAYDELRRLANEQFANGLDKPSINIKIDWIELSKTNEYKQYANLEKVRLGDTIVANVFGLDYETRVISTEYDGIKDMIVNFQVGTFNPTISTQMNSIKNYVERINPTSILQDARDEATRLITGAMGGYVYKTQNELYIMDTDDPTTAQKVWRWNINGLGYSSTGVNGTYGTAMTMNGSINADFITTGKINTNMVEGYGELVLQVTDLNRKIQDVANITVTAEDNDAEVELENVNASQPIYFEVRPTTINISYLYPSENLYPSDDLFPTNRGIVEFHNTTTDEYFEYPIEYDLLVYSEEIYDKLIWDYDSGKITIFKNCEYSSVNGKVIEKEEPETIEIEIPSNILNLTSGDYQVKILGYTSAYLKVQLMASNIYTTQYVTNSEFRQKSNEFTLQINGKVGNDVYNNATISAKLNDGTSNIKLRADKIDINGVVELINNGTSTKINGNQIETGTLSADTIKSGGSLSGQAISGGSINIGNNTYYLRMGANWTRNPEVSGLNVGTQGIRVNNLGFNSNGSKWTFSGNMKSNGSFECNSLSNNGTTDLYGNMVQHSGTFTSYGDIKANVIDPGGYLLIKTGGRTSPSTAAGSMYLYSGLNITLNASSGHYVYVGNADRGNTRCAVDNDGPSSRILKKNIQEFKQNEYDDALDLLNDIKLYDYNYKYNIHPKEEQFGFIIDDLLEDKRANKFFYFKDEQAVVNEKNYLDYSCEAKGKKINFKRYDEETLIKYLLVVCKGLQQKIKEIEK